MSHILDRVILGASALTLIVVGAGATFAPASFYASYAISLEGSVELANELRAVGGALLFVGIAVAVALTRRTWLFPAAVTTSAVMLGLAAGRAVSVISDGRPASSIVIAGVVELVLGLAAVWVAVRRRPRAA